VLAAGVDYKTGDATLAMHQRAFFDKIGKPLYKLSAGGDLAGEMTGAVRTGTPARRTPDPHRGQRGSAKLGLMGAVAGIGAVVLFHSLVTHSLPEVEDVVRIGLEARFPVLGLVQARDHGETVIPVLCMYLPKACAGAAVAAGAFFAGYKARVAVEHKAREVHDTIFQGILRDVLGVYR
jgi:hypothetical protein